MDSLKTYVVVWLSGMVAGLVLLLRWQHLGSRALPSVASGGEAGPNEAASAAEPAPPHKQTLARVMITGANADIDRARHLFRKVTSSGKATTPSPADVTGASNEPSR